MLLRLINCRFIIIIIIIIIICSYRYKIVVCVSVYSSRSLRRSRRKMRDPYVPVVGDDVGKSVRPVRSRLDDVIYPTLLVDDCAHATGCRDCACADGFCGNVMAASGQDVAAPVQRLRRATTQTARCAADCMQCGQRPTSTAVYAHRKSNTPPFPPPPPPPPVVSASRRQRVPEALSCCANLTPNSHDAVRSATSTTLVDSDRQLQQSISTVDERLSCSSTGGAVGETHGDQ